MTTVGQSMTISAWINLPNTNGTYGIAAMTNTGSVGWDLVVDGDQLATRLVGGQGNTSWDWYYSGFNIPAKTWTFVAMTWTAGGSLTFYIDGRSTPFRKT